MDTLLSKPAGFGAWIVQKPQAWLAASRCGGKFGLIGEGFPAIGTEPKTSERSKSGMLCWALPFHSFSAMSLRKRVPPADAPLVSTSRADVRTETVVCCFKAMAKRDGGEKSSFVSDNRSASKDRPIELPQSVGGLNGSMQHWHGVYSREYQSPKSAWGVD
jgi:hypothetical protein